MHALDLQLADAEGLDWAENVLSYGHYLESPPDQRSRPLYYLAYLDGERIGCLTFGRPEAQRCLAGELRYGSAEDLATGRAEYDRWEVLCLSRLWLHPAAQYGGRLCRREGCPGFMDRRGFWRPTTASDLIRLALTRIGCGYLLVHPPVYIEQPYRIRAVMSYCDTKRHKGTVYRAAGWQLARTNEAGIETWWTSTVAPLTAEQDERVRQAASVSPRSWRIRNANRTLFDGLPEEATRWG